MIVALVPAWNEATTIGPVVAGARAHVPVIVVDDGATDETSERAGRAGADLVLRHPSRRGKGAALRTGFAAALRRGATRVVTLDGDGQHDPADLPRLVAASERLPEALVIGDRLAWPAGDRVPLLRLAALRVVDWGVRRLARVPLHDSQCGYRLYPAALLRDLTLDDEGFVFETAVLFHTLRTGRAIVSVPVRRLYHPGRHSRFRAVADGGRITALLGREAAGQLRGRLGLLRPPRRTPAPPPVSLEV